MNQRFFETLIGFLVVAVAAGFLFVMFQNNKGVSGSDHYQVTANFYRAEGISVGSEVRLAGIAIGEVVDMELLPDTLQAQMKINLDQAIKIPTDSEINIASDGLLGGAFVEIVPGADETAIAEGGGFLYTNDSVSLINLLASFASSGGTE